MTFTDNEARLIEKAHAGNAQAKELLIKLWAEEAAAEDDELQAEKAAGPVGRCKDRLWALVAFFAAF